MPGGLVQPGRTGPEHAYGRLQRPVGQSELAAEVFGDAPYQRAAAHGDPVLEPRGGLLQRFDRRCLLSPACRVSATSEASHWRASSAW